MINRCYIYKILCVSTNKFYIGSTNSYNKRFREHKRNLIRKIHSNSKLQNAWNKYKQENFKFIILEQLDCTKEEKLKKEQEYIDNLCPYYNIAKTATCPMQGRKHKFKAKQIMSKTHKDNKYRLGQKASEYTKDLQRLQRYGTKRNQQTKQKMSETAKRINSASRFDRKKSYRAIKDQYGNIYESLTDAANKLNMTIQCICDTLKGRHKNKKGYIFEYIK